MDEDEWRCLTCKKGVKLGSFVRERGIVTVKDRLVQIDLEQQQVQVICPHCLTPHRIEYKNGVIYKIGAKGREGG